MSKRGPRAAMGQSFHMLRLISRRANGYRFSFEHCGAYSAAGGGGIGYNSSAR